MEISKYFSSILIIHHVHHIMNILMKLFNPSKFLVIIMVKFRKNVVEPHLNEACTLSCVLHLASHEY